MNALKRTTALALCAGLIFSLCSCADEAPPVSNVSEVEQTLDISSSYAPAVTDKLETPVISYLGTSSVLEESVELYRRTYAAQYFDEPSGRYVFPDGSGELIISRIVPEGQLLDELTSAIQSDASPDITDKLDNSYPYLMSRNIYEDLTAYMDMSSPQWVDMEEYVDRYEYNGKHFYYPWDSILSPQMLYYNRGLFEEYGIPDPAELLEQDNWTWETFLEDCRLFVRTGENVAGIYGAEIADNFIASTGVMLIGRNENGKLMSNFTAEDITRAAEWLDENLAQTGLADLECSENAAAEGLAAFYSADRGYDGAELFPVPYPRDGASDKYFCRAATVGYLVPKGAKNVAGACCFINCCRLGVYGNAPEETAESVEPMTEEALEMTPEDIFARLGDPDMFSGLADENICLSEETNAMIREMLDGMLDGDLWEQKLDENLPIVNAAIDELNSLV
ncbi:MAG: extracellular solute-binding protein [Oscillospiraceae bacterium]|nr:extracellular solute-binding protein [Oscillospiraceae bacterium]